MARMTKVELFAAIRRDARLEGLSVRALARKYGVHRRTVREALTSAWPKPRKRMPPRRSRLDPFKPAIDQMLWADLDAPRKQRHTVKRIFDRLVAEHEMEGISYSTVCNYVAARRPEIRREAGRSGRGGCRAPEDDRRGDPPPPDPEGLMRWRRVTCEMAVKSRQVRAAWTSSSPAAPC
jgi:transposase